MTTPLPAPALSIIVPVLNESRGIVDALAPLQAWRSAACELICVDGGSADDTLALAAPLCDRAIVSARGRARQMNAGAAIAHGQLLLFLHADTRLPPDAVLTLKSLLGTGPLWGRFDVQIDGRDPLLRVVATMMNLRSRLTGVATGDQAIFVTRDLFAVCGGFPVLDLMEDVALSKRLRRRLPPRCLRSRVTTSGRRWEQGGPLRTIVLMWGLRLAYVLGIDPARLARWYRHTR